MMDQLTVRWKAKDGSCYYATNDSPALFIRSHQVVQEYTYIENQNNELERPFSVHAQGILLDTYATGGRIDTPSSWTAWVPDTVPFSVHCKAGGAYTVGSGKHGGMVFDGKPRITDPVVLALRKAENHTSVRLPLNMDGMTTPFFLLPTSTLKPRSYLVEVRLTLQKLVDLPDLEAVRSYLSLPFYTVGVSGKARLNPTIEWASGILDAARSTNLAVGHCLPIGVMEGRKYIPGALLLEQDLDENIFLARLYITDSLSQIEQGSELIRKTSWIQNNELTEFKKVIAVIRKVLSI